MLGSRIFNTLSCNNHVLNSVRYARTAAKRLLPIPKFEKRLDVVIMGAPNAGKSVLLNRMVDSKLAATSRKRHTTRNEMLGVFNYRNTQLAFYDTPGYVRKAEALQTMVKRLSTRAELTTKKADVVLIIVDAARCSNVHYHDAFCEMVRIGLDNAKKEIILVLNKVDLIKPKSNLLEITRMLVSLINGVKHGPGGEKKAKLDTTTFMVSGLQNDGLVDIKNYLVSIADIKPWVVSSEDGITSIPMEQRVEEMVREKLLDHVHEEIPYIADVECVSIDQITRSGSRVEINVNIWVDTSGQQRIVVGQQGRVLVAIRQDAVADLEKILGVQVILKLWVKVKTGREGLDDDMNEEDVQLPL